MATTWDIRNTDGKVLFKSKTAPSFRDAVIEAVAKEVDLSDACLSANLAGAALTGAQLRGADMHSSYLRGASLRHARLTGANLERSRMQGADLEEAVLRSANLAGVDLSGANLVGADLVGADLSNAELSGANLCRADLCGATLNHASLWGAYLKDADLSDADLIVGGTNGACLLGANMAGGKAPPSVLAEKQMQKVVQDYGMGAAEAWVACSLVGRTDVLPRGLLKRKKAAAYLHERYGWTPVAA